MANQKAAMDFGKGPIGSLLMRSVLPLLAAQLLNLLYNIVDRIYIARIPGCGQESLAGLGLCFPLITIMTAFINLFSSGGASLAAIAWGEKRIQKSQKIMNTSFYLLVFGSLILGGLGLLFSRSLLVLFGADEAMLQYSLSYLRIYLCGSLFSFISLGLNPFFNAQGRFLTGMASILIGAFCNIVLDPIFIFVLNLGINGAAIATVIAQILAAIFAFCQMRSKNSFWRIEPFSRMFCSWSIISDITSLGLAGFIMQLTNSAVQIAQNQVLINIGGNEYVTVMTIVNSVRQITDTVVFAMADGTSPLISYCYGAGLYARLKKLIRIMTGMLCSYTLLMWILILLVPDAFVALFDSGTGLRDAAVHGMNIYFFAYIFQALQYSGQTVFKAMNKKKQAIFFSLFRKVVIVVPLIYLLPHVWTPPVYGVFASEPISNVIGGLACFITMYFTVYRRLDSKA